MRSAVCYVCWRHSTRTALLEPHSWTPTFSLSPRLQRTSWRRQVKQTEVISDFAMRLKVGSSGHLRVLARGGQGPRVPVNVLADMWSMGRRCSCCPAAAPPTPPHTHCSL